MSQQIVVKPQGVITEPNKVGQYPAGAFSVTNNACIRSFGVLELVRKFRNLDVVSWGGNVVGGAYSVSEGATTVFLAEIGLPGSWRLVVYVANNIGSFTTYTLTIPLPWSGYITNDGRTGIILMRNRVVISGTTRSFVIDLIEPASAPGTRVFGGPRNCGISQGIIVARNTTTGAADDPALLSPNSHFSACSMIRVTHDDGYEVTAVPSIPSDYANLSTTLPQVYSDWAQIWDVEDTGPVLYPHKVVLETYRTREQSVGYDNVNNKYRPIASGSSFYLTMSKPSPVQNFGFADQTRDFTLPNTLGEALLTNVSVGGATAIPTPPPPAAKTSAVFRGYAFYANFWDSATFTLLNPYFWGFMPIATSTAILLAQGFGNRFTNSGQTATNGSPTVTGLPNTIGIVAGQIFNVYRSDTGAFAIAGARVISTTSTTVTCDTNSVYTGAVRVETYDIIEVMGSPSSAVSPESFVRQFTSPTTNSVSRRLDVVSVGVEPITTENPVGVYPNFVPTGGYLFRLRTNEPFTIRATNGQNFSPKLPALASPVYSVPGKQQKNGFTWSENNQPENCPPSNYAFVGLGEIYKIIATRDCLWFFCSDGLFRLSGAGGSVGDEYDWVVDPVDPTLVICNPACACVFKDYVYAYTNRGFVSISSEGVVRPLSDGRIGPSGNTDFFLENRGWRTVTSPTGIDGGWNWVVADAANNEIWVKDDGPGGQTLWVYNVKTDTWCMRFPTLYDGTVPCVATYNAQNEGVLMMYGGRSVTVTSLGFSGEYEDLYVRYQPIFGGKSGSDAYTLKHWQDVNLSFDTPQPNNFCSTRLESQGVIAGTRLIPVATRTGTQLEMARVGFTVPRAFPAIANAIVPELSIFVGGLFDSEPFKLEGMAISYIEFTEQRLKR